MDRALEHGINFMDTSNVYGWQSGNDWTENVIGRWFDKGGQRRERTVIATKVYQSLSDWPNDGKLSARHIRQACDASLSRLQTDYIDLYQMHHVDRDTPWGREIRLVMKVLRAQGKILYVGSSNFAGWHIAQAQEAAKARHFLGLISEQSKYNLVTRDVERELLPAAAEYGIGLMVWSPLQRGLLGGILALENEGGLRGHRVDAKARVKYRPQLTRYEALCAEIGSAAGARRPGRAALSRPGATSPIVGAATADQLYDVVRCLEVRLDDAALARPAGHLPGATGPHQRTTPGEPAA